MTFCQYAYDPLDRLAAVSIKDGAESRYFYGEGQLTTDVQADRQRSLVRAGGQLLAQHEQAGDQSSSILMGVDRQQSVLHAAAAQQQGQMTYSPYGHREPTAFAGLPGFNGEQPDSVTGHYLLGNGYRAFNPVLMRFNSPDSLSPFAGGGLNPYTYCLGDPINRVDPTGHMSWQAGLGLGFSVLGIVASIATFGAATPLAIAGLTSGLASGAAGIAQAVTEKTNPQASSVLGWVGLGLGMASAGFGVAAGFQEIAGRLYGKLHQPLSSNGGRNIFSISTNHPIPIQQSSPVVALSRQEEAIRDVAQSLAGNELLEFMELSKDFKTAVPRHLRRSAVSGHADMFSAESIYRLRRIALGVEPGYLPSQVLDYENLKLMTQELPIGGVYEVERQKFTQYFLELSKWGRV